ncbi:MAG: hypothetical protein PHE10_04930, partial [Kiritimatiellae bacterium]|nr:hypothetical protein [Kiritimatiellia bacterium]
MMKDKTNKWMLATGAAMAVSAAVAMYAFSVWFGNLNQDEGWYLYAARMVSEGKRPNRDSFFTQGPVMPLRYGLLFRV